MKRAAVLFSALAAVLVALVCNLLLFLVIPLLSDSRPAFVPDYDHAVPLAPADLMPPAEQAFSPERLTTEPPLPQSPPKPLPEPAQAAPPEAAEAPLTVELPDFSPELSAQLAPGPEVEPPKPARPEPEAAGSNPGAPETTAIVNQPPAPEPISEPDEHPAPAAETASQAAGPAAEQSAEQSADRPADRPVNQLVDKSVDQTRNQPAAFELDVDVAPRLTHAVQPKYPYEARRKGIEGQVRVRFLVNQNGGVEQISIEHAEPHGVFEDAVLEAVRQWRFTPGQVQGKPAATWVVVPLTFSLSS